MILQATKRALLYGAVGLCLLVIACIGEIMYGTGMSHPIWNREYDWSPIIYGILTTTSVMAGARTLLESYWRPRRRKSIRIKVATDLSREYSIAIRGV